MITAANVQRYPRWVRREFEALATRWPVGAAVRLPDGSPGRVSEDPGGRWSLAGGAHCLITPAADGNAAVCVSWPVGGVQAVAWYRPAVLRRTT